jgi:hypothetical protein
MDEHEAIEESARSLLDDLADDRLGSDELAAQFGELARTIEAHIDVEDGVVAGVDAARLAGPWATAWRDGLSDFDRLKADWIAFLGQWDRDAIARDRHGFRHAAEAILGRIRERLQVETQAFYATALQTGAIELR